MYTASVAAWKSTDGGKTFVGWRGAPGGDDYHRLWINPTNPNIILLAGDQGAIVTVNGGETWSSWYNQPTAQFYHVIADNAFPYRVCGGQQESGSACVASRGDDGRVTVREWHPVAAEEYGYIAPDPADPDIVYGGKLTRYDRRTGQAQDVMPPQDATFRVLRTAPLLFMPLDARTLFFASDVLWKTLNGGRSWTAISPDLSRPTWPVPPTVGVYRPTPAAQPSRRGVIYAVGPSYVDANIIWAGTDDGAIDVTRDAGRTWTNVTPKQLTPWAKVSVLEASHFDVNMAYAAINTLRLDDLRPHILRTKDAGVTWVEITRGLPAGSVVNTVREDPDRRGLLFAGTEQAVYLSFDDGENWQPLRLNMPATSIRDLTIKGDDLIAGTHGRGFWILDDIMPLRWITPDVARAPAFLFRPATAWRVPWNTNTDTPLPPDEPSAPNPPDGLTLSYLIGRGTAGPVTLEINDAVSGEVVRRFSSEDPPDPSVPSPDIPDYWIRPAQRLSSEPGLHRFVWDLRYGPPAVPTFDYSIAAAPHDTPKSPQGIWVMPGTYQVRLTAGGRAYRQAVVVKMDPRVKTSVLDLGLQFKASKTIDDGLRQAAAALADLKGRAASASSPDRAAAIQAVASEVERASAPLPDLLARLQSADMRPTDALTAATTAALASLTTALADYQALNKGRVRACPEARRRAPTFSTHGSSHISVADVSASDGGIVAPAPDVRRLLPLTPAVFYVLLALADEDRHGYGVAKDVAERTANAVRLGPGTLYGTLTRLTAAGLVVERQTRATDDRRRYYRLTPFGRRVAEAEARRLAQMVGIARAKALLVPERTRGDPSLRAAAPPSRAAAGASHRECVPAARAGVSWVGRPALWTVDVHGLGRRRRHGSTAGRHLVARRSGHSGAMSSSRVGGDRASRLPRSPSAILAQHPRQPRDGGTDMDTVLSDARLAVRRLAQSSGLHRDRRDNAHARHRAHDGGLHGGRSIHPAPVLLPGHRPHGRDERALRDGADVGFVAQLPRLEGPEHRPAGTWHLSQRRGQSDGRGSTRTAQWQHRLSLGVRIDGDRAPARSRLLGCGRSAGLRSCGRDQRAPLADSLRSRSGCRRSARYAERRAVHDCRRDARGDALPLTPHGRVAVGRADGADVSHRPRQPSWPHGDWPAEAWRVARRRADGDGSDRAPPRRRLPHHEQPYARRRQCLS